MKYLFMIFICLKLLMASDKSEIAECSSLLILSGNALINQGQYTSGNKLKSEGIFLARKGGEFYGSESFSDYALDTMKEIYQKMLQSPDKTYFANKLEYCDSLYYKLK